MNNNQTTKSIYRDATSDTLPFKGRPFTAEQTKKHLDDFNRDGCVHLGNLLTAQEVTTLKQCIDEAFADPDSQAAGRIYSPMTCVRLFETNRLFRDMLVREPIISLIETLLGADCHLLSSNAVRNQPGKAIDTYHVDDLLFFPLPDEVPRFDPRLTIPTFMLNVQIALTDIPSDEYGPTQFIPGTHYSGRHPNDKTNPTWEDRKPVSIPCKAGDVYLQHSQVWHRGAPNTSDRTRYLYQLSYARRVIAQRFYPFMNYKMPDHVLEGAGERLLRVLGKHPKGAYG